MLTPTIFLAMQISFIELNQLNPGAGADAGRNSNEVESRELDGSETYFSNGSDKTRTVTKLDNIGEDSECRFFKSFIARSCYKGIRIFSYNPNAALSAYCTISFISDKCCLGIFLQDNHLKII